MANVRGQAVGSKPQKEESSMAPQPDASQQRVQPPKKQRSDFEFGKILGEGSYSEVVQATEKTTRKEYAIKVLLKRQMIRENKQKYVMRERDVLTRLNHPFFVKLYFTFQDKDRLYFGLSLAKRGELLPYIHKVGSFDECTTRFYSAEIILALEHMHSLGIIHRDLKPENILLNEDWHIQITDFGSAKILEADSSDGIVRANSFVGTAQYVSPELLTTNRTERVEKSASKCSDLWALGAIIYQLLAGLPPFRAGTEYLIFQKILKLEYVFPDGFPEKARDLVQKLLVIDPKKRLGCDECGGYPKLKAHPFFQGVDWDNIHKQTPPALKPFTMLDGEEIHSDYYVDDFNILTPNSLSDVFEKINTNETENEKTHSKKYVLDHSSEERAHLLSKQEKDVKWHQFVEGNLILKMGLVDKRKGLFARRRQLLLTEGPHLYYVDPENMVLKGEIPWSRTLKVEAKNFKTFFVHTPNRTYYLIDPEGYALEWCRAIDEMMHYTYQA
ncbi:3-phosphoinositide-dependent protein kinase 1-like isoform X2 [Anneissia japonica]|uniref:3-phosphoinositide-dependent protein kinase 1-like isoform X2 n=1 Tax=Anneissia japonica TaxID=1529436 RepID=UPI0014254F0E|nr:3-phosphoinositide-dependent protein kinase 1-like isoform X2 [Anneissia japonica]